MVEFGNNNNNNNNNNNKSKNYQLTTLNCGALML